MTTSALSICILFQIFIHTHTNIHTHTHTHTHIYIYIYIYCYPQTDLTRRLLQAGNEARLTLR